MVCYAVYQYACKVTLVNTEIRSASLKRGATEPRQQSANTKLMWESTEERQKNQTFPCLCGKQQRCMCVANSSTDRSTIAGTLLWAARWHGAAVGAHLTTPVIILAFNQEGILHSYPCSAWGSRAWQIELTAKVVSRDRAEAVWTDRAGYTLPRTPHSTIPWIRTILSNRLTHLN